LSEGGALDPRRDNGDSAIEDWLASDSSAPTDRLVRMVLRSTDPDDLTLCEARMLGQADHIYAGESVPDSILNRARADAQRHGGALPETLPPGLVLHVQLPTGSETATNAA
jgi:uroporphyrin-III C-methyltransferase / precorrin-2 dehydrogenase / sirohydrochlorin ferrochelatase